MKGGLATMIAQYEGEWNEHLHWVLRGYCCSRQASTHMSPFFVVTGRNPRMPIENVMDVKQQPAPTKYQAKAENVTCMERAFIIFQANQQILLNNEQADQTTTIVYATKECGDLRLVGTKENTS